MSSTRLPGKVLMDIKGRPMLWHVVHRVCQSKLLDETLVATSDNALDDSIAEFCEQEGIRCFRGSEGDVLDRYHQAARWVGAHAIVRVTADCPLIDPVVLDKVVAVYLDGEYEYVSNALERTYPDGLDTEVFSFKALEKAWREATLSSEREHVTPYIWKNEEISRLRQVIQEPDLSSFRWTVDEPEDMQFVRKVYDHLYQPGEIFLMQDVVKLLEGHPGLLAINPGFGTNEGYIRSLQEDHVVWMPLEEDQKGDAGG
jgi:spore coat polysaccharide biosynthesis protein SpsF (cytidylyltransferase family)